MILPPAKARQLSFSCLSPPMWLLSTAAPRTSFAPTAERVTNRDAIAYYVARTEFDVVVYEVQSHFRSNEEISVWVDSNATTKIAHEVVAAHVIGAVSINVAVLVAVRVEANALSTDSGQRLSSNVFAETSRVHGVKVIEQWAVGELAAIHALARSPVHFGLHSHVPLPERLEENISIESHKRPTTLG